MRGEHLRAWHLALGHSRHSKAPYSAYFVGLVWRRAVALFLPRRERLTRASTKRSRIWTITPRCFFSTGGSGPRRTGGGIFSNVNAGIVCPLVIELKHPLKHPGVPFVVSFVTPERSAVRGHSFRPFGAVHNPSMDHAECEGFTSHCG